MVGLLGTPQTNKPPRPHDLSSNGEMRMSSYPLNAKRAAFISKITNWLENRHSIQAVDKCCLLAPLK